MFGSATIPFILSTSSLHISSSPVPVLADFENRYYIPHKSVKNNGWKEDKDSSSNFTILSQDSGPIAVLFNTGPLEGLVRFDFAAMDAWYEEDVEIYVHPRDPHVRVDVLPSTREVRVEIDGVEVAKSNNVMMLFETGLPPRYYLPQTSVCGEEKRIDGMDDNVLH